MTEPISVRVMRLNNVILGRSEATSKIPKSIAEALCREGLLDAFCLLYNECNKENLKKKDKNINEFINKYREIISETTKLRVHINDFSIKGLIGKGYFGDVYVGTERSTKDVYAIKKIRKSSTITSQVKEERDIMVNSTSEWITALQYAFQDEENLYLVMEYVPGGDLLSLMIRNGAFDEELARFYLAEMTLALNTLHTMGYVHRDIKPENILLDRFGHLKLADFGNAMHLNKDGNVISISPVGTPDYIAPELLQTLSTLKYTKSVHDVTCDYWSMGIIGYEFLTETTPFHEDNVHETYSNILSHCEDPNPKKLYYPAGIDVSPMFRDLIDNLVTKPSKRLTCKQIIEHPFFESIDWDNLRHEVPPIIPTLSGEDDTSNFEDVDKKGRRSTFTKTQSKGFVNRNDFTGQNLPFLGYGYIYEGHQEKHLVNDEFDSVEVNKLKSKTKELQNTIDEQTKDIKSLQHNLLIAQKKSVQTESLEKILLEAKQELDSMKDKLKEKTIELAACKTDIKTLRSSLKIEEEMRVESDRNISQILNSTYQKWEKAKKLSEQNYEKQIAEKKTEIANLTQNLLARENELSAKVDECNHLQDRVENYKEMLTTSKEQNVVDKIEFDKNKKQLTDAYEAKIIELKDRLKQEKESRHKLVDELRMANQEMNECTQIIKNNEGQRVVSDKNFDDLKNRLGKQIEENKLLREMNANFERTHDDLNKRLEEVSIEAIRRQEQHNIVVASRRSSGVNIDQFHSAHGSLETINSAIEDQLRYDLMTAQENENHQRDRADRLEKVVSRLEEALNRFQSKSGDTLLERQNEKLGDQLATVREQAIVDRQASRAAHLSLWKLEKQVEELHLDKKLANRRLEQAEDKFKKLRDERDEIERKHRDHLNVIQTRDEKIKDLQQQINELRQNLTKEHGMWESAELERMKEKSEIIEHVSKIHVLESHLEEQKRKLQTIEKRNDGLAMENKRLNREMNDERNELCQMKELVNELESKLENMQQNYDMLKEACTLMEAQLTELEAMHENEVKQNKLNCEKIDNLWRNIRAKDEHIQKMHIEINEFKTNKIVSETKCAQLQMEINQLTSDLTGQKQQLIDQQTEIIEKTTNLYQTQEHLELQTSELGNVQRVNANFERELHILKEENAKLLTELFLVKEEASNLMMDLRESKKENADLKKEIDQINGTLSEQKNYYVQREIKSEATQVQYKKLISYLQQKVEDLSTKKKKSLATVLFGSNSASKKENISPNIFIDDSSTIKRMEEDLNRERARNNQLKEQLLKAKTDLRAIQGGDRRKEEMPNIVADSPNKANKNSVSEEVIPVPKNVTKNNSPQAHRFEMTLEQKESHKKQVTCPVCQKQILTGHPYWNCKVCVASCHRRCRSSVKTFCDTNGPFVSSEESKQNKDELETKTSSDSDDLVDLLQTSDYKGDIILPSTSFPSNKIFCAYQATEDVFLFGAESGLYSFNQTTKSLVQIHGIDHVNHIATNVNLSKCILIADNGQNLYQCDLRHLQSRAQASSCLKPKIEATVIEIPFANRVATERWHYSTIHSPNKNVAEALVIACTTSRIVILQFDIAMHKFKPVCALDTAMPVTSILFTRHSAIVSADKFFEIDLSNLSAEEFLNESDPSILMTQNCRPMAVCQINKQEFLLCFEEFGIFVDEYGSRSRPDNLNWSDRPTGFMYREPLLFVTYNDLVQIVRINKSYANEVEIKQKIVDGIQDEMRANIMINSPKLIGEFGSLGVCILSQHIEFYGDIIEIDGVKALKSQLSDSMETFFSSLSSIPREVGISSDTLSTIGSTWNSAS